MPSSPTYPISPTQRMERVLPTLRVELASAATTGRTVTYSEASAAIGPAHVTRGMGPLLTALGHLCAERGEPNLAALVVTSHDRTAEGSGSHDGSTASAGAAQERRRVWRHWGGESALRAGVAREAAGLLGVS